MIDSPLVSKNLIGRSRVWKRLLRQVVEVARFSDAPILITGESGTGKELVARLVHSLQLRKSRSDLVLLDCSTIVPELSGSEFFGHERGAFTGAVNARDGAFALADGGTLFLDEVGELPPRLQAELLRAVQEKTYKRVGGNSWHKTDFRLVCATNRNLIDEQHAGNFRLDLYYRIASCTCHLPPLRERRDDLLLLVDYFMNEALVKREDSDGYLVDNAVREYLLSRDYPGNIRELKQLVTRMLIRHVGPGPLTVGDIPEDERPSRTGRHIDWRHDGFEQAISRAIAQGLGMKEIGREAEESAERIVIDQEGGNPQRAAQRLGVSDRTLQLRRASRNQDRYDGAA
ncbi:MAG: sigma 54-interacting transcriptional regulator [Blastocatellia bacterium]